MRPTTESWVAKDNLVLDETGLLVASVEGQDDDNSETEVIARTPAMFRVLCDVVTVLKESGQLYADDETAHRAMSLLGQLEHTSWGWGQSGAPFTPDTFGFAYLGRIFRTNHNATLVEVRTRNGAWQRTVNGRVIKKAAEWLRRVRT